MEFPGASVVCDSNLSAVKVLSPSRRQGLRKGLAALSCLFTLTLLAADPIFLSELLFNVPGADAPHEYIEIRGRPNLTLPQGTYLVGLEGDVSGNPGTVHDVFDLSGRMIGASGFLVLLQKASPYVPSPLCLAVANTGSDPGWGHGSGSTVRHRGQSGQTDIENPSATFLLVQTDGGVAVGDDWDSDDDGVLDPQVLRAVRIHDSVGVLDADGAGDIGYGLINFRRSTAPGSGALALGRVVPVGFTPGWVGRVGDSTGYADGDWAASELPQPATPGDLVLGNSNNTHPSSLAGQRLNHLGLPNFGGTLAPGVLVSTPGDPWVMAESGATNSYFLRLTVPASAPVLIEATADAGLEVSTDLGISFGSVRTLRILDTNPVAVVVRTVPNTTVEPSPRTASIRHRVGAPDPAAYWQAIVPPAQVLVPDDDLVLLNEVSANPVGADESLEFIELRGQPGALLRGVWAVVVNGDSSQEPGGCLLAVDLDSVRIGDSGLVMLASPGSPYPHSPGTPWIDVPEFDTPGGVIPNGPMSILLVTTLSTLSPDQDLDQGNNGILEGLGKGARILDSIAWISKASDDIAYGAQLVRSAGAVPDAATRRTGNSTTNSPSAWYFGELKSGADGGLGYNRPADSTTIPPGATLTPGFINNAVPSITPIAALSGAIGDPTQPGVDFTVSDFESPASALTVRAYSSNEVVIPTSGLRLQPRGDGAWRLNFFPTGVGYARVTLEVSDGVAVTRGSFPYAVSAAADVRTRYLLGAGDGSTAVPMPDGLVWVGDDENQVIRLYDRNRSGFPVVGVDFSPRLGLTDIESGIPREVDIEGSTRSGDRIFWMGAHSHANIAEPRTNRSRLFATDLVMTDAGPSLSYVGRYDFLKLDLVRWDAENRHGRGGNRYGLAASTEAGVDPKAVDGSGFNLEGLAMAPGSSEVAYVCCRAPLVPAADRTFALIIPVLNFATLAASDGPPGSARFGEPIEMDLFGRGIRSMEGIGSNYLIIAGPPAQAPGNYPHDFRLYTWNGDPASPPTLRTAVLQGLNPEGIVDLPPLPWSGTNEVQLLSDWGARSWYGDGVETKALPERGFKKSRLDWIRLGEPVPAEPLIVSFRILPGGVELRWRGVKGQRYRVQRTDRLSGGLWVDAAADIIATGPWTTLRQAVPDDDVRFYRVLAVSIP